MSINFKVPGKKNVRTMFVYDYCTFGIKCNFFTCLKLIILKLPTHWYLYFLKHKNLVLVYFVMSRYGCLMVALWWSVGDLMKAASLPIPAGKHWLCRGGRVYLFPLYRDPSLLFLFSVSFLFLILIYFVTSLALHPFVIY